MKKIFPASFWSVLTRIPVLLELPKTKTRFPVPAGRIRQESASHLKAGGNFWSDIIFHFVIFPLFPVDFEGRSSGKAAGDDRCSKEDLRSLGPELA